MSKYNTFIMENNITSIMYCNLRIDAPLKTKNRLLYLNAKSVQRCKHFSSRL